MSSLLPVKVRQRRNVMDEALVCAEPALAQR